jgi:hypothetical protein
MHVNPKAFPERWERIERRLLQAKWKVFNN